MSEMTLEDIISDCVNFALGSMGENIHELSFFCAIEENK